MSQSSIKKNFAYKSILTISTYLISFITFPYVARVLGVEHIGLVNFVDNTVNYFLLFATMGIGLLGVREIAAVKENKKNKMAVLCRKVKENIKNFWQDEDGMGVVEIVLIIVVLIGLVIIFKSQITALVNKLLSKMSSQANKI